MGLRISPGGQIKQSPKIDLRLKDTEGEERERGRRRENELIYEDLKGQNVWR